MTPRSPSSYLYAVSSISIAQRHLLQKSTATYGCTTIFFCCYATQQRQTSKAVTPRTQSTAVARQPSTLPTKIVQVTGHEEYSPKAALLAVESGNMQDNLNPPLSTLPPPLNLPKRSSEQNLFVYLYRLGSGYGTFYKNGVKAVWYNRKAARMLQEQLKQRLQKHFEKTQARSGSKTGMRAMPAQNLLAPAASALNLLSRAENEILARHKRDIGKLPLFAVLVVVFGEWLPLIVPFMPSVVPGTCLIPSQIEGMRKAAEERRKISFRKGLVLATSTIEKVRSTNLKATEINHKVVLQPLGHDQLLHLSTTLGLHKRLWDRLNIMPPRFLLTRSVMRRAQYIGLDDKLLWTQGAISRLSSQELAIACELRGIDVLHQSDASLREILSWWLTKQQKDNTLGGAFLDMLFKRPNAWGERSRLGI